MKRTNQLIITSFLFAALCSCQDKKEENTGTKVTETTTVEQTAPTEEQFTAKECYLKVIGKDSIRLSMQRKGDSITGDFLWKPFEKDLKRNTFKGILKGTEANAVAGVMAEGMASVEEFDFTVQDSTVAVKFAEMEEGKDGVWHYKKNAPSSLQVLYKVSCK